MTVVGPDVFIVTSAVKFAFFKVNTFANSIEAYSVFAAVGIRANTFCRCHLKGVIDDNSEMVLLVFQVVVCNHAC